ncbi:MAG: SDR family oxidoreductase [Verrucomicrobiota bacterium]|jgi:NAD(P)-dependent dehydrogenase (short-subunit alcohol dehydrogenase family)|nr:SDR family oxidoreductase [Verrucomicrobiota bacterium]
MKQTVLITGAALRLGAAIARTLARAGWSVVIHARRAAAQAEALRAELAPASVWTVTGDLLPPGGPDAVFDAALACAGRLDALVNNAAVFSRQPLASATADDFERHWRLNALAPILLTQRLARHLAERDAPGAVVNLLDQRIVRPAADAVPYLLSKKALEAYTFSAALGFAPRVRVNAVAPGAVLPPSDAAASEPAGAFPLGAPPLADAVADAVRLLLDTPALTGQVLFIDGGQHLL